MIDDPIVDSTRKVRDKLSAPFGYDVHKIFADLRRRESQLGGRLIRQSTPKSTPPVRIPPVQDAGSDTT